MMKKMNQDQIQAQVFLILNKSYFCHFYLKTHKKRNNFEHLYD
jgi:hypothetical protein